MESIELSGRTAFLAGWDGEVQGTLGVSDTLRNTAVTAVGNLHDQGVAVTMLTGDNQRTAEAIARQVGIDRVIAEVCRGRGTTLPTIA